MSCGCLFCEESRFTLNKSVGLPGEESIVYQDEHVYVTPDVAPILFGHFLIVSKQHYSCCGSMNHAELDAIEKAKAFLKAFVFKNRPMLFFEHGAVIEHTAGSCIDHAHIHAMPVIETMNIDDYIKKSGFVQTGRRTADRGALKKCAEEQQPYIYGEIDESERWYYPVGYLPSQFFRAMIASQLNREYSWMQQYKTQESQELFAQTLSYARKMAPDVVHI